MESARVRYGHVVALDDVSVAIPPGEVVAVVGGDGAGKSTLLRAVVGEAPLASGSVTAPDPTRIGYLPASVGSWLDLTVTQNLDFVGGVYGLGRAERAGRAEALLASAGLEHARDRPSRQLSGGMRRKLGFCLAMIHDPPLLILDEPSTGVDPVSRVDLWRLISEAAANGAAVLMTTTYLDEAERAAHLLALDGGRAIISGTPGQALSDVPGVVVETREPVRRNWAWRRGRVFHEYWPRGSGPGRGTVLEPDLEDAVVVASLLRRAEPEVAS